RRESRYQYSALIVYNNFPWPFSPADSESNQPPAQADQARAAIEKEAQVVLDARAQFAGSSLADLYDPLTMPPVLLKAHQRLDAAVDKAYQLAGGPKSYASDAERVAFLFTLYQRLTSLLPLAAPARAGRRRAAAAGPAAG
ncbi:MAG: class I SAM-dependent DNA methyltransferase, partial [Burkholderiales bacterium]|nr:class I SAM-dependent DNA methyltransferase [Burkholderiales bacterium]